MKEKGSQFHQLAMFVPAKDLMDPEKTHSSETAYFGGRAEMWRVKRAQNDRSGLVGSLQRHGMIEPVEVKSPNEVNENQVPWMSGENIGDRILLSNGHHRTAAAFDISPEYEVPVRYTDDIAFRQYKRNLQGGE